jgi:hypothetical protein
VIFFYLLPHSGTGHMSLRLLQPEISDPSNSLLILIDPSSSNFRLLDNRTYINKQILKFKENFSTMFAKTGTY